MHTRKLGMTIYKLVDLIVLLSMILANPLTVLAAVWTDPTDYPPGATITIHGANTDEDNDHNFAEGEVVIVVATGPYGYSDALTTCSTMTDQAGAWACDITIPADPAISVGTWTYTATGQTSGNVETGTFTDAQAPDGHPSIDPLPANPPSTSIYLSSDSGGENDIDPTSLNNQSDLSAYGRNGTGFANTTTQYGWKWDNPYLAGNNSQDVCVYLSSTTSRTDDPNAAEYAVCYSIITDAAGNITTQYWDAYYYPTYSTADASSGGQKCFGNSTPNLPNGVDIQAAFLFTQNVAQQFPADPDLDSKAILNVWSNIDLTLINICSKKSASPSSDSADCGLERAPAFLKLVKAVQSGTAVPSDWTLYWDGPSTSDGSVKGDNTQFVPVPDGTYTLSESSVTNYEQVSLVCSPTTNTGSSVTLVQGVEETCTFTNKLSVVAPTPRVIKGNAEGNDTVATLNEPGGSVTFNVVVYNDAAAGISDATLTSLSDDIYGDITTIGHNGITETTCATGGAIAGGSSYSCSFTVSITSEPATIHDTVTATLQNSHSSVSDTDDANVVISNVSTPLSIVKSAEFLTLPEPGGTFNFSVLITNPSTVDTVSLTSVTDTYGTPDCGGVATLAPLASVTCTFSAVHTGNFGDDWTNTVTVVATDDDGAPVGGDSNPITVSLTDVLPAITVTKTAGQQRVQAERLEPRAVLLQHVLCRLWRRGCCPYSAVPVGGPGEYADPHLRQCDLYHQQQWADLPDAWHRVDESYSNLCRP